MEFKIGENVVMIADSRKGVLFEGYVDGEYWGQVVSITDGVQNTKRLTIYLRWNNSVVIFRNDGSVYGTRYLGMSIHKILELK